jgi:hypothetical protein
LAPTQKLGVLIKSFISKIDVKNGVGGYHGQTFITIDIDWAPDFVILDTVELLLKYNVVATILVTHDSPLLQDLRSHKNFEFGIHPNVNPLLNGSAQNGEDAKKVMENIIKIVPHAKVARSHSLATNSLIQQIYKEYGITHDLNTFIPTHANMTLKPFISWNNLVIVPYCWEDDVHLSYDRIGIKEKEPKDIHSLVNVGVKVINFHPIHIYLNTESLDRYENSREFHRNLEKLEEYRYQGYGTRNRFIELISKL